MGIFSDLSVKCEMRWGFNARNQSILDYPPILVPAVWGRFYTTCSRKLELQAEFQTSMDVNGLAYSIFSSSIKRGLIFPAIYCLDFPSENNRPNFVWGFPSARHGHEDARIEIH